MANGVSPMVPISIGELIDKITILRIKVARIRDETKRANVAAELRELEAVRAASVPVSPEVSALEAELIRANEIIWDTEDEIRVCERESRFDSRFIELARTAYLTNDRRAAAKKRINEATGSYLVEEKSHE